MLDYFNAKSWPFAEAKKLKDRMANQDNQKGYVLFETGYGPSGLPHMGTFAEVFRTTLVRRAFEKIDDTPTRLICFSDDMDGLRKVPENVPNRDLLAQYIGYPLTSVPDPFGQYDSFGAHNNARLRAFIEQYGFEYEFRSATEEYKSGRFDKALLNVLNNYELIMQVMLPSLREERQKTYSAILPISPVSGKVLMVSLDGINKEKGTVLFKDENGDQHEVPVTGGHCKLQWKADWAMRWYAQNVDYEMAGRDLAPTFHLSDRICRILGGTTPNNLIYELFVDENGQKISKSKGNGLTIDQWMAYGTPESMAHFIYTRPTSTRKIHMGSVATTTREYFSNLARYEQQGPIDQIENPVWYIHNGNPLPPIRGIDFDLVVNVASVSGIEDPSALSSQIKKNKGDKVDWDHPLFDALVEKGVNFYIDHVKPNRVYRPPSPLEKQGIIESAQIIAAMSDGLDDESYQDVFYAVGKKYFGKEGLREWFKGVYEVTFGQADGPRMGGFTNLYGRQETVDLLLSAANSDLVIKAKATHAID